MNKTEQKAYDALGDVQKYYRTHGVTAGSLWRDKNGYPAMNANGEESACIWGAMIAAGYRTEKQYNNDADHELTEPFFSSTRSVRVRKPRASFSPAARTRPESPAG